MNFRKNLPVYALLALAIIFIAVLAHNKPPIIHSSINTDSFGAISLAEPLWGSQGLALIFLDTQRFNANDLENRLANLGLNTAIVDIHPVFKTFNTDSEQCMDGNSVASYLNELTKQLALSSENRLIVAGVSAGALIPFINALSSASVNNITNLSIDFSVNLPDNLHLCPPLTSQIRNKTRILASTPTLQSDWRSVWSDQPADETGVFIRSLGNIDTRIAPYDTPLDKLLIEELNTALGKNDKSAPPMPVVEVPVAKTSDTVTLFYSGDGGWRDLDRTVAGEMTAQNYPVVGVDVLRYFWEHKTPEQAAADLATTMAYYRKHWGTKSFVLAGYSFGADILPPIYNRLPQSDRDSVSLLVLLALADHADFEIHVSGWLGQSAGELALAPELSKMPKSKILCVYGKDEKNETACTGLANSDATILELPGGHHFDQDYPKLTKKILDVYRRHGIE